MKAVVLLSGGIDSATTLYYAKAKGYKTLCLTFDYGQRHKKEVDYARRMAKKAGAKWELLKISLRREGCSLLDKSMKLPQGETSRRNIPTTYVPGRNIIFLSYAVSYAESLGAEAIFIGANQIDYSGYPDCRAVFIEAFNRVIKEGTAEGVRSTNNMRVEAPLVKKNKAQIIRMAISLRVPLELTWSCYKGGRRPCGRCDSCLIRAKSFKEAGIKDPLLNG